MVVVIIIAIIAMLAVPSVEVAQWDRATYTDAGSIMQIFREARMRAVARGGAEVVSLSASTTDRGTFVLYEAVSANAKGLGLARTPVSSCKTPTSWLPLSNTNPNLLQVDSVNLNGGQDEAVANIQTAMAFYQDPTTNTATGFNTGYVCYTPLGQSYVSLGAGSSPLFDGKLPTITPIVLSVTRTGSGNTRDVLVPPNGMARLFSHI
jgi:Tfp pilus assembly protein FimT